MVRSLRLLVGCLTISLVFFLSTLLNRPEYIKLPPEFDHEQQAEVYRLPSREGDDTSPDWTQRHVHNVVAEYIPLPKPDGGVSSIQHRFKGYLKKEPEDQRTQRTRRAESVRDKILRVFEAYKAHAWRKDELTPIAGGAKDVSGGWAMFLVEILDTLWITGLTTQFDEALDVIVEVDFFTTSKRTINVHETTTRLMGGLLASYDLSGDKRLLNKTLELAEMLYSAFDTQNRMPVQRINFHKTANAVHQQWAPHQIPLAEIAGLALEFTRLTQITNDPRWYDAVARIMEPLEAQQNTTGLPGMWPTSVNARKRNFAEGSDYSLSTPIYSDLIKMSALLGGSHQYERLYRTAIDAAVEHTLVQPMSPVGNYLLAGTAVAVDGSISPQSRIDSSSCQAGGMLALGGSLLKNQRFLDIGRNITDGCVWLSDSFQLGIMPRSITIVPCDSASTCAWDEAKWHASIMEHASPEEGDSSAIKVIERERLPQGISSIPDESYYLGHETIESLFVLYRITGDKSLQDIAWTMFENVCARTETEFANAALRDVTDESNPKIDKMDAEWVAATLKYFYLIFADADEISLDEWVFSSAGHPFRRS